MSSPSHSPQSLQKQQIHESDVVYPDSQSQNLIQEIPNQPDPPSKPDPDTKDQEEQDDEEEQEIPQTPSIPSGMPLHVVPPITDPHVSVSDVTLESPSHNPNPRRGANKRKKGKPNIKKQQSIKKKLQSLMVRFNPIPFIPLKIPDFSKHEKLLKNLGLWEFVHIDFDRTIRVDLITQFVATYDPKLRCSYVNNFRISVNRGDFAHAFKLPVRKKSNIGGVEGVELDGEEVLEDSIEFIVEFVSDWVLLHEDAWMMPIEVMNWLKLIKDGHPGKVDWAGLFRFMVEKELMRGDQLGDCYYASHLQHLLKFKREEVFFREEPVAEKVELDGEAKEEGEEVNEGDVMVGGTIDGQGEESCVMGGPSIELTLGQDSEKEENVKDVEMMDVEKCMENDDDGGEEEEREEQGQWLLNGKNNLGEHFMQRCSMEDGRGFGSLEDRKEEEEEMEGDGGEDEAQRFDVFPTDDDLDGDGLTGNLLQAMEVNQTGFNSQGQLRDPSSMNIRDDMQHVACSSSFFDHTGKRVIEHDNDITHHSLNDTNKRLRINDSWNHKPVDFGMCMEQIQQMTERASMFYEEKEQDMEQSNTNQQILLNELQKRDAVIDHLHKTRLEEIQKKDGEIYRREHELYLMGNVLDGYRKALKETQTVFADYRQRAQLPEEPTYKDSGPGDLMLSTAEMEKICKKQEEYKMNCSIVEQKMKEAEVDCGIQFDEYLDRISILDKKLTGLETDAKELIQLHAVPKIPLTEEKVAEVALAEPLVA